MGVEMSFQPQMSDSPKTEEQWDERFGGALENAGGSNLFETFGNDMDTVNAADPKCVGLFSMAKVTTNISFQVSIM